MDVKSVNRNNRLNKKTKTKATSGSDLNPSKLGSDLNNSKMETIDTVVAGQVSIWKDAPGPKPYYSDKMSLEDNVYLSSVIGEPLMQCLGEMVSKAPLDPIEWIAHWLYNYINAKTYHQEKAKFFEELEKVRIAMKEEERRRRRKLRQMREDLYDFQRKLGEMRPGQFMPGEMFMDMTGGAHRGSQRGSHRGGSHSYWRRDDGDTSERSYYSSASGRSYYSKDSAPSTKKNFHPDGTPYSEEEERAKYEEEKAKRRAHELAKKGLKMTESGRVVKKDGTALTSQEMMAIQEELDRKEERALSRENSRGHSRKGSNQMKSELNSRKVTATWGVDCRLALVCRHPVLGDMQARPPMVFPETPEKWQEIGYIENTLYDHEVYSRDVRNDSPDPEWDAMEPMTLAEVMDTGPWLATGFSAKAEDQFCSSRIKAERRATIQKYRKKPAPGRVQSFE